MEGQCAGVGLGERKPSRKKALSLETTLETFLLQWTGATDGKGFPGPER